MTSDAPAADTPATTATPTEPPVRELRLVVTAADYDEALRFYRDVLGLPERAAFSSPDGRVTILDAGRATLELTDPSHAEFIDEVEVGRRVAGHVRVAFQVDENARRPARTGGASGSEAPPGAYLSVSVIIGA